MAFGYMPDGSQVTRHEISGGGLSASVLSYGAVLQDLRLARHDAPLVLGFDRFAPYLTESPYFGAMAGRCANRIGKGQFALDGQEYQLDCNIGAHHLHGGSRGTGVRNWTVDNVAPDRIDMSIVLEDGEMGYPGRMDVKLSYACLEGGVFDIRVTATTDAPTICNFAHHSYWNLSGEGTIDHHLMRIDADLVTQVDGNLIPTGALGDVTDTRFDFRRERKIADEIFVDHNLCLSAGREPIRKVGSLRSETSGLRMEIRTTEPGLQVYDGYNIDVASPGLDGVQYGAGAGLALEPQIWPDAINHDTFPSPVLRPGETYDQHTQFVFSRG